MHCLVTVVALLIPGASHADPLTFINRASASIESAETVMYDPNFKVFRIAAGPHLRTFSPRGGGETGQTEGIFDIDLGDEIAVRDDFGLHRTTPASAGLDQEILDSPFFQRLGEAEWVFTHIGFNPKAGGRGTEAFAIQVTVPGEPPLRRGAVVTSLGIGSDTSASLNVPRRIFHGLASDHGLPDCVAVLEGEWQAIGVDEGEPISGTDSPGSLTLFSYTPGALDPRSYQENPSTKTVVIPDELAGGAGVRIHPSLVDTPSIDIEPEYITIDGDTAYVTLQENNAIGVFDIAGAKWTEIIPIPVITQTIDANDKDGIAINQQVRCMPMPDQIAHTQGALFFPGEGDTRAELGEGGVEDHARLEDLVKAGKALPQPGLGRLKVCTFTGDTDGDGVIDQPHAFGSRALHKYDLATKEWSDTGSIIERTIAERFPEHFADNRSDDRGPEPEGIVVGEIEGKTVLFVSVERPGAVMAFDTRLNFLGMVMSAAEGHTGPEGMCFVSKDQSPLGVDTLAVAFEASGHLVLYEVALASTDEEGQ